MTPGNNWLSWMQEGDRYYEKALLRGALFLYPGITNGSFQFLVVVKKR